MQRRALAFIVFLAAAGYLGYEYLRKPPPALPPPPPVLEQPDPGPVFAESDIEKIRLSLKDGDPGVRLSAAQLLYNIHDPQLGPLLDKMIAEDPDPEVRMKVISLVQGRADLVRLGGLVRGLSDTDKDVRIKALSALGDIGDPSVATWVTSLLKDPEPDVRIAALVTLGRFQDKRKKEFHELAEKLKRDYEESLRRAAERDGTARIIPVDDSGQPVH
jgi:HEAT repeat protein